VTGSKTSLAAQVTATALIAQQVGANAIRDGLLLSFFPVQSLPYFVAGAALLAIIAAHFSGRLLARLGPVRLVPILFTASAALFLVEWMLLGWQARAATALLYMHSSVLGSIAISAFWSLLNERFDPYSAKPMLTRVAAAATFGGFVGGVSAERVVALFRESTLLPLLALACGVCIAGAVALGRGAPASRASQDDEARQAGLWAQFKQQRLLRDLGLVIAMAAMVAALADYLLKAEAVAYFGKGPQLSRFFGVFYAFTGLSSALIQTFLGRLAIGALGLGGSVATHPAVVAAASVVGFVLPTPWRGILPRVLDVVVRNSTFRTGYELLYTPLAEATKRSAKSIIDVACDCAGKGAGAVLILALVALAPSYPFASVNLAVALAAAGEFVVARRLRAGYVSALEGGLRRQDQHVEQAIEYSMADFTTVRSMAGLDRAALLRAVGSASPVAAPGPSADPAIAAIEAFRSEDLMRIRAALRAPPRDPIVIAALVQLLAKDDVLRSAVGALEAFGARAAGELVSVLLDPATPDVLRRRLPLALKSCASPIARDGLQMALDGFRFEISLRCGRALLELTDEHPELQKPFPEALALAERQLASGGEPLLVREQVFNLLALALDREPMRIAARAFATDDAYVRGTALEYLETVLPENLFSAFRPLLDAAGPVPVRQRPAADVRAELIRAGATITVNLSELRSRLDATVSEET
jgi:hypothetical protein